jgi:hypothetical protein
MNGIPYGAALTIEQRLARLEQTIDPPAVRVRRDAAYTVASLTVADISWDTVEKNEFGMWDAGSPTRITFDQSGWYAFGCEVAMIPAGATGDYAVHVRKNGSDYLAIDYENAVPTTSGRVEITASGLAHFDAGDYITGFAYQTTGTTRDANVAEDTNAFWAYRVGA